MHTQICTLDNGLKIYMTVNKTEPRLQTMIAVKVGGKNDPSDNTGLAHYFEHIMFKGTEKLGTSDFASEKVLLDEIERLFEIYKLTTDEAERASIYHKSEIPLLVKFNVYIFAETYYIFGKNEIFRIIYV